MKIKYKYIKKIHLYASLSTVAILTMFIVTSYMMMNHNLVDHELVKEEKLVNVEKIPASLAEWKSFASENHIEGRKTKEQTDKDGNLSVEYAHAGGFTRINIPKDSQQANLVYSRKKTGNAIIGIHRLRGYGGQWYYNIYALLLDTIGISLILFVITGVIMWFKLLKNNKIAWLIFIAGFVYVGITILLLLYW